MKKLRATDSVYKPRPLCYWCEGTGRELDPGRRYEPPRFVACTVCGGHGTR